MCWLSLYSFEMFCEITNVKVLIRLPFVLVISGVVIVMTIVMFPFIHNSVALSCFIRYEMDNITERICPKIGFTGNVETRHLPHYTRFKSCLVFTNSGITRSYSPSSLSSLSSVYIVANSDPKKVQGDYS